MPGGLGLPRPAPYTASQTNWSKVWVSVPFCVRIGSSCVIQPDALDRAHVESVLRAGSCFLKCESRSRGKKTAHPTAGDELLQLSVAKTKHISRDQVTSGKVVTRRCSSAGSFCCRLGLRAPHHYSGPGWCQGKFRAIGMRRGTSILGIGQKVPSIARRLMTNFVGAPDTPLFDMLRTGRMEYRYWLLRKRPSSDASPTHSFANSVSIRPGRDISRAAHQSFYCRKATENSVAIHCEAPPFPISYPSTCHDGFTLIAAVEDHAVERPVPSHSRPCLCRCARHPASSTGNCRRASHRNRAASTRCPRV